MRLLYVIDSLAPGGAETSLAELAPGLVRAGIDLHVLSLRPRLDLAPRLKQAGAVVHVGQADRRGRIGNLRDVIDVARAIQPALIHTTLYEADISGRAAARILGIAASTSIVNDSYGPSHYQEVNSLKLHAARMLDAGTSAFAQRFHSITQAIAENVAPRIGISLPQIEVIPRGRDPQPFPFRPAGVRVRVRKELGVAQDAPVILAVARHEPQKGLHHLLNAIPIASSGYPDLVVLLAGKDGRSTKALREQAVGTNVDVRFLGHRTDVADLMAASDVFCFPSLREGFGGVLIEAMAVGCPVVASDIPASREVLGSGASSVGVLTPSGDDDALSRALTAVLSDGRLTHDSAVRARRRFEARFTTDKVVDQMVHFFNRIDHYDRLRWPTSGVRLGSRPVHGSVAPRDDSSIASLAVQQRIANDPAGSVAAIVVTYRRPQALIETLNGIFSQSHGPASVTIVDNDNDQDLRRHISASWPEATYIGSSRNLGYGAGLALGMRSARDELNPAWFWLLDDDSPPHEDHLRAALDATLANPTPWIVSGRGGFVGWTIRHRSNAVEQITPAHFALIDGALVSAACVRAVGYPREDLFMMFEDIEYSTRVRRHGGPIVLAPGILDQSRHMGTSGHWRAYYQSRNHLRSAIDLRSWTLFRTWGIRQVSFTLSDLSLRRRRKLKLRWRGAFDAVRDRMGTTLKPS